MQQDVYNIKEIYMDVNKCIIMLILAILFVNLIAGVGQSIVNINNKITEMFDDISLLKITSNNTLLAMNNYYSTIRETQTEIENNLLTEIACLATKNNNDMKELKEKIILNNQDNTLKKNNIKNKQHTQYKIKYKHPLEEPKIIRCKDCKYWIPYDWMFGEIWQSKNIADYSENEIGCKYCDMSMKANDFCSRAERREVTT